MCGMKSIIHSQTSTVEPFEIGNGEIISFHTFLSMRLLIHAGIKFIPCQEKGLLVEDKEQSVHRNVIDKLFRIISVLAPEGLIMYLVPIFVNRGSQIY